jgi:cyclase
VAGLGSTMRVLRPAPCVFAFYDGRVGDRRVWSEAPNWLDDGAYTLGACSYAIVDGGDALVWDTHISLEHAALMRRTLTDAGVRSVRVALSHWHADHVAGNAVFADCEIIANVRTRRALENNRAKLESGNPPIRPLTSPTRSFEEALRLQVGAITVDLLQFDIHSHDGTVALLPELKLLLAGDTLEDPITYVAEPDRLDQHLVELDRLATLAVDRILPNHGSPNVIEAGGYGPDLIIATRRYARNLLRSRNDDKLASRDLRTFIDEDLRAGIVGYHPAYEPVHRRNVERVVAA